MRLRGEQLAGLDRRRVQELGRELTEAASLGAWSTGADTDPWFGARIATSEEAVRARDITAGSARASSDVGQTMSEVFAVSRPPGRTVADWGRTLAAVGRVRDTLEVFRPEVFDIPLDDLVAATGSSSHRKERASPRLARTLALRRQARSLLRPGAPPADLHAALVDAQQQRTAWRAMAGARRPPGDPGGPRRGRARRTAPRRADLTWLGERLATTPAGGRPDADPAARPAATGSLSSTPGRTGSPSSARCSASSTSCAPPGWSRSSTTSPPAASTPSDVGAELDFVWWTSLSRGPRRARPALRRPRR